MIDVIPTVLALVVVALFGVALAALSSGDHMVAGLAFLSASVTIYLRETR